MTAEYRSVVGLRARLSKFSGIIAKGLKKPKKKLIKEMQSLKLKILVKRILIYRRDSLAWPTFSSVLISDRKTQQIPAVGVLTMVAFWVKKIGRNSFR